MAKKNKVEQPLVENGLKEQTVKTQEQVSENKYPGNTTRAFRG